MNKIIKNRDYIRKFFLYAFVLSLGLVAPISVDITKIICGLGIIVLGILYKDNIGQTIEKNRIYFWGLQAFVVYMLLLVLFGWLFIKNNYAPSFSTIEMVLTFYTMLALFVLLISIDIDLETIKKILLLFCTSVVVNGFFVLFFIYGYKEFFINPIETLKVVAQQRFTVGHFVLGKMIFTKDYSLYFGIAALISAYCLILLKSKYKILLFLILLFNILFLLLTNTRGSIIGFFIAGIPLLILFLKRQKRVYKIIYCIVISLILLCVILNLPDTITNRFHEIPTETNAFIKHGEDEGSASTRLRIWQIIFSHSNEFWLFGNNPLYSNQILHQYFIEADHQDYVEQTHLSHNVYLSYWLEGGIIAVLFLLFILLYPIIQMIYQKQFSYLGVGVILFLCIVGMEDRYYGGNHRPAMLLFFIFFISIIGNCLHDIEPKTNK